MLKGTAANAQYWTRVGREKHLDWPRDQAFSHQSYLPTSHSILPSVLHQAQGASLRDTQTKVLETIRKLL
jgi:hypothetical protein